MSKAMNAIFPVLVYLSQGYCLQYFYGSFLEGRMRDKRLNGAAAAALYVFSRLVISRMYPQEIWDYKASIWRLLEALVLLAVLALGFYKAFRLITVFLVTAFQAAADISRFAAIILFGELGDGMLKVWSRCVDHGMFQTERAIVTAINLGLFLVWILEYLAITLLLLLPLKKIVRDFCEKDYDIHRTELLFLLTPAAVGLLLCVLLRVIMITIEDGIPRTLYDRYPILIVLLPAVLLLSLLSVLQGVKLFQNMVCRSRERSGRIILEKQIESLKGHMEEMERVYSGVRSMEHDMKNTFSVILRLMAGTEDREEGEEESGGNEAAGNEELKSYLTEINHTFERLKVRFRTGNTIVDTLLNMKYHEAVREMPDLKMDADRLLFPMELNIQSYDLGIILGNALDNAIEACRKLKGKEAEADVFIRLFSLRRRNLLILTVENSFDGRIARNGQSTFPMTEKEDKCFHGIGLANIRSTAEKYQGTMDYRIEGRVFILSVMMKDEKRESG